MSKYLLVLLGLCCVHSASAQLNWQSKGPLYEDKYITVEIEYAMGDDPCGAGGASSQYRYKITRLQNHGAYFLNWRFDYFNCDHQLRTHANTLPITQKMRTGYILPRDNQFSALRLANNFNEVKKSPGLPAVTAYDPKSPTSLEPKALTGKLAINKGEATTLTFLGGYLAPNTIWKWYEGDCNGRPLGSGTSIAVQPQRTTTYALRGEGAHPTPCLLATVTVANISLAATAIEGKSQVCEGERNIRLTVAGGNLADGANWVWYQDNCGGTPAGEGYTINVSPARTTSYYVRAEGPGGNTACQVHVLTVAAKSKAADRIDGADRSRYGDSFTLTVHGGGLAADARWVWYSGTVDNKLLLGTGSSFTIAAIHADQTYYVRAEGTCANSEFASKTVRVTERPRPIPSPAATTRSATFFINGGVVANDPNQLSGLKNYVVTIGGGKNIGWFVRAKISSDPSKAEYETAGTQITNYDLPGYYQYNGKMVSQRAAYTGGVYFGGSNMAFYIGGGYGTRELLYEIDRYSYGSSFSSGSTWVKNTGYSYTGAEIEGGLLLKAGSFNIMGGVSTIQGKYTDYNVGIGFNF